MDLKTLRENVKKLSEQPKSNWPTYEEVKKSSKILHDTIYKLFKGHVVKFKNYTDCGDITGLPTILPKQ